MTPPTKKFDFESYVVQQFDSVKEQFTEMNKKLDNMDSRFVPREEIMLMHTNTLSTITTLSTNTESNTKAIASLKEESDQVKGAILTLKIGFAFLTALGAIVGGLWWVKG